MSDRDTIFALSSGRVPAAIAVVRISGPRASLALQALIGRVPAPRTASLAVVRDAGEPIDEALALWFPAPHSETGEDTAELQLHGSRAVLAAVFRALSRIDGVRAAEAGEFTRRAFANGKLDLTRVEGLADLIAADTEAQRRQAFRQLRGLLGERAETWRASLIKILALVEAGIDFSDEGDVPVGGLESARHAARELLEEMEETILSSGRGERLREGLVVALAGPVNVGKSSLLNRIARREAAIVSPYAGTTRDVIEVHLDLGGYPVTLLDTAGLRESDDPVEREGIARARARAAAADLVLWVCDARNPVPAPPMSEVPAWMVRNKIDLLDVTDPLNKLNNRKAKASVIDDRSFDLAAATGLGVDRLLEELARFVSDFVGSTEPALVTRARQRQALGEAVAALGRALAPGLGDDLVAEELHLTARGLGRLTGRVDVEHILDVIFRDFCIGK